MPPPIIVGRRYLAVIPEELRKRQARNLEGLFHGECIVSGEQADGSVFVVWLDRELVDVAGEPCCFLPPLALVKLLGETEPCP